MSGTNISSQQGTKESYSSPTCLGVRPMTRYCGCLNVVAGCVIVSILELLWGIWNLAAPLIGVGNVYQLILSLHIMAGSYGLYACQKREIAAARTNYYINLVVLPMNFIVFVTLAVLGDVVTNAWACLIVFCICCHFLHLFFSFPVLLEIQSHSTNQPLLKYDTPAQGYHYQKIQDQENPIAA